MSGTVQPYTAVPAGTDIGYGIHHVQLPIPAGGEPACREFYLKVLGLTEVAKPAGLAARGGLWVRADRLELHLGVQQDFRPQHKGHPGILVANLDRLAARARAAGLEPEFDELFVGMRRFYLPDPHGNRLEFLSTDN